MNQENRRAAQRAHDNAGRTDEDYDDEGRPAAARARDAEPSGEHRPDTRADGGDREQRDSP